MTAFQQRLLEKGFTQQALARKVGVTQAAVCGWVSGQTMPRPKRIEQMARVLSTTPHQLIQALSNQPITAASPMDAPRAN